MFKNYIKISLRNILKYKVYSLINILGLAVGIACFVMLMLWVNDELSYDTFHENSENIYRIVLVDKTTETHSKYAVAAAPITPGLKEEFPEVKSFTRFIIPPGRDALIEIKESEQKFYENNIAWGDKNVFEFFTFNLISGNAESVIDKPGQVVLTESTAKKLFGNENPVGKSITLTMRFRESGDKRDYLVTGVMKDIPSNSHLKFNMLCSISSLDEVMPGQINDWGFHAYYSYLLLNENSDLNDINSRITNFIKKNYDAATAANTSLELQPIKNIHLTNNILFEPSPGGNIIYIYILTIIGFSILLIASVNYMNLATARSANRAKEVGIKKVLGAFKKDLAKQFLGESVILSFIALLISILIIEMLLPAFNEISGKQISANYFGNFYVIPLLIFTAFITGLISGSYPAIYLSSLTPVSILKGNLSSASRNILLRKLLIIAQFTISIIMFSGTFVVYDQLTYLKKSDLGFKKEQVMLIPITPDEDRFNPEVLKNEFKNSPHILEAGLSSETPGDLLPMYSMRGEGKSEEELITMVTVSIDENYIPTMGIEFKAGRNFSKNFASDSIGFVINESAAYSLGFSSAESAIGKNIDAPEINKSGKVIGVVKDFNFTSLHRKIEPLVFHWG